MRSAILTSLIASFVLGTLVSSDLALADVSESVATVPAVSVMPELANINKGNVAVGGSVGASYYKSGSYSNTTFNINPSVEYFVAKGLSVGGSIQSWFFADGGSSNFGIGPSITYHFLRGEKWTTSAGLAAIVGQYNRDWDSGTRVDGYLTGYANFAANYFVNPAVSIGPVLQFSRVFTDTTPGNFNASLMFQASVFL